MPSNPAERLQIRVVAFVVLLVSAALHFARLEHPRETVFDEVYFSTQVGSYCCSHVRFMDIHPPLAKLAAASVVSISGYDGSLELTKTGDSYKTTSPVWFRAVPALFGTLLPLVVFLIALQLGSSLAGATLAAALTTFDNALLGQTRVMALDGSLVLFTLLTMAAHLALRASKRPARNVVLAIGAGAAMAMAVGSKFTGLTAIGCAGLVTLYRVGSDFSLRRLREELRILVWSSAAFLAVYVGGWWMHFELLTVTSPTVPDWGLFDGPSFISDLVRTHRVILNANSGLTAPHPDYSSWWAWPFGWKPIPYWQGSTSLITLLANPIVWWSTTAALATTVGLAVLTRVSALRIGPEAGAWPRWPVILVLGCYLGAYAPLAKVSRGLFLYHYLTPLLFGILMTALLVDRIGFTRPGSLARQRVSYFALVALVVAVFATLAPNTYGLRAPWSAQMEKVMPKWR